MPNVRAGGLESAAEGKEGYEIRKGGVPFVAFKVPFTIPIKRNRGATRSEPFVFGDDYPRLYGDSESRATPALATADDVFRRGAFHTPAESECQPVDDAAGMQCVAGACAEEIRIGSRPDCRVGIVQVP